VSGLLKRFRDGDRQALARILSNVENQTPLGDEAVRALSGDAGNTHLVGITGPPGAGKSTLANEIVKAVRRKGKRTAVLAIDPSSPVSGGATMGDRIRMLETQHDDGVYLRSMASRGQVGGLALAAFGSALILDAFGFDIVLIETVGTGQDEVDIARLADSVVVVQTPGMGDSIQAVKAGILEIADILVVNKADQPGADETVHDLRQQVRTGNYEGWRIPVLPINSSTGAGVEELLTVIDEHRTFTLRRKPVQERRCERTAQHARMLALREFASFLNDIHDFHVETDDPSELADQMIQTFLKSRSSNQETV
jgi:LAO/AO transport system kinase